MFCCIFSRNNTIFYSSPVCVRLQYKAEEESRTEGSRPRPRTQKTIRGQSQGHKKNPRPRPRTALPRTDPLEAKDRNARGQGQGPRTQKQVFSKKKVFKNFFQAISKRENQKGSSQIFCEVSGVFLHNLKNEQIPTIVRTDANAHRTI